MPGPSTPSLPEPLLEDLKSSVDRMRTATDVFHSMSLRTKGAMFMHFPGIINAYIDLCQSAISKGHNFLEKPPPASTENLKYIKEKLLDLFGQELFFHR